jgi:hypothetical protein
MDTGWQRDCVSFGHQNIRETTKQNFLANKKIISKGVLQVCQIHPRCGIRFGGASENHTEIMAIGYLLANGRVMTTSESE